ncbi:tRNA (uridine-5-oxyacetic acid methyl ester) 34 synthase [Methylophaga frappieri]|uniref:Carboxy-S-adenosyl-L-methionine synthase n=1 Tax=Methylophaga frappieri (strain ATCC BAA-2434 / DSM 25690 / JAM7) TaxID=754477 RepID=I1YEP1_METFJ|nr:carboxy-S-adenosyl-L-methionine synthase CmoA [Methylophaga frappieri]AFJ01384.1 tRNA (uridine-5-oxyacetic acid methyl ester) 34 synthase [Methylophaga frappieri]
MTRKTDNIYASALTEMVDFRFDERVADVFPDMIQRSVPGYATLIAGIGILADKYAIEKTHCYDLGCSLGAVTLSMRQRIKAAHCRIIAIDNSAAMIERAERIVKADNSRVPVSLRQEDICHSPITNASVVVMNFTLQFVPVDQRNALIAKVYAGLEPGGVLIVSEKLTFDDADSAAWFIDSHLDFKRANGYSDMEISQKRSALEHVLIPETESAHHARFAQAGFQRSLRWFQCFNFASFIAFK